jgi:hypothetical protein
VPQSGLLFSSALSAPNRSFEARVPVKATNATHSNKSITQQLFLQALLVAEEHKIHKL